MSRLVPIHPNDESHASRFPAQEKGDFKIPTVLYYTQDGNVRAAGAEACSSEMELIAEDEDLILVEW